MKPATIEEIEQKAKDLMESFGPVMRDSAEELRKFTSPEEGYFFAFELVECVLMHLCKQYVNVPQIPAVLNSFKAMLATLVLSQHRETMDALGQFRAAELKRSILERLETIEDTEDVDLRVVKSHLDDIAEKMKDPLTLVEVAVKAGAFN